VFNVNPRPALHSVSFSSIVIESITFGLRSRLNTKGARNAMPLSFLTFEIATKESPAEKSLAPMSTVASSRVRPWLLWIVIAQPRASGS
jgi:hypothetical protein